MIEINYIYNDIITSIHVNIQAGYWYTSIT